MGQEAVHESQMAGQDTTKDIWRLLNHNRGILSLAKIKLKNDKAARS